jgi:beta-phosphoglucomutase-like phosphatase (HAD superfamily)
MTGLVIFDCDGVLVDSEPVMNRAHVEMLQQHGYAVSAALLFERFTGVSDADMLSTIARANTASRCRRTTWCASML